MKTLTPIQRDLPHPSLAGEEALQALFKVAVQSVDPLGVAAAFLPPPPKGRTVVVGAGKAAARMALAVERAWSGPVSGLVVTRYGHGEVCQRIEVMEASHPVPDAAGVEAAQRMLQSVRGLSHDDLVLSLISGGGSALLTLPIEGVTLQDKQELTLALLKSGAPISDINRVRRCLSAIKGGKLAEAAGAAAVWTLVVSDVPGDDPALVASGPTVPAPNEVDPLSILKRHGIPISNPVQEAIERARAQKLTNPLGRREVRLVATADTMLHAVALQAQRWGWDVTDWGSQVEGESREVAVAHARQARQLARTATATGRPQLLLSGGETTVTVRGQGRGGRNAEFLLALALQLQDLPDWTALAADTDGIDGSEDNAGAVVTAQTVALSQQRGMHPQQLLDNNNAYEFFLQMGALVMTGPTRTNVNDFRAILLMPSPA
jgi:glycerate 2-kinase